MIRFCPNRAQASCGSTLLLLLLGSSNNGQGISASVDSAPLDTLSSSVVAFPLTFFSRCTPYQCSFDVWWWPTPRLLLAIQLSPPWAQRLASGVWLHVRAQLGGIHNGLIRSVNSSCYDWGVRVTAEAAPPGSRSLSNNCFGKQVDGSVGGGHRFQWGGRGSEHVGPWVLGGRAES